MTTRTWMHLFILPCALLLAVACDSANGGASAQKSWEPRDITTQECAACGMVVRDQPAPRGQLVHADGTRAFFCSLGDMAHYMAAPSPHGPAETVFVELLDPSREASQTNAEARPWLDASEAFYVLGVSRPGIMGPPVLSYRTRAEAAAVAERSGGHVEDFSTMREETLSPP